MPDQFEDLSFVAASKISADAGQSRAR